MAVARKSSPRVKTGYTLEERLAKAWVAKTEAEQNFKDLQKEWAESTEFGTEPFPALGIKIQKVHYSSLNKKRAVDLYGHLDIYGEPTPSADKLKQVLTGAQYTELLVEGAPVVKVLAL